jgi:hypothetical protein
MAKGSEKRSRQYTSIRGAQPATTVGSTTAAVVPGSMRKVPGWFGIRGPVQEDLKKGWVRCACAQQCASAYRRRHAVVHLYRDSLKNQQATELRGSSLGSATKQRRREQIHDEDVLQIEFKGRAAEVAS